MVDGYWLEVHCIFLCVRTLLLHRNFKAISTNNHWLTLPLVDTTTFWNIPQPAGQLLWNHPPWVQLTGASPRDLDHMALSWKPWCTPKRYGLLIRVAPWLLLDIVSRYHHGDGQILIWWPNSQIHHPSTSNPRCQLNKKCFNHRRSFNWTGCSLPTK